MTPNTILNPKVLRSKKMQTSYNEDAKNVKQKAVREDLSFLIDLATIIMVAEDEGNTEEGPKNFNEAWNHPGMES